MTVQNIGYWIGQANDSSGGTHPTGWTTGQRYSETATEWKAMYDAKVTELATMTTNYNNMVTDRNYWQHTVSHNDPSVWDNRYNAGYAAGVPAGAATKTTSAVGTGTSGTGGLPGWPSTSGDLGAVACPRTGLAHVSYRTGSNGDDAAVHIFKNGVLAIEGPSQNGGLNTSFAVHGNINVNAGDTISCRASGSGDSGLQGGYLLVTVGSV